jgi:hypothetical protein
MGVGGGGGGGGGPPPPPPPTTPAPRIIEKIPYYQQGTLGRAPC